jgi:uncharacterized protein YcaQ
MKVGAAVSAPVRLSSQEARRLTILGQMLGGRRPRGVVEAVEGLGRVQVDPTSVVDRAERLVLWSRIGAYDRDELRRALEAPPRQLFEYAAFLIPVTEMALHQPVMRRYPRPEYTRGRYIREWLDDNATFRRYVLDELRARGPLRSRDLDDRAEVPWRTGGWNDGKNTGRMLEIVWQAGEIAISRREGGQRVWDLFERVFPAAGRAEPLLDEVVAIELMERQLRVSGFVAPGWGSALDYRLPAREVGEETLKADGTAVPVTIDRLPGEWLAHRDLLEALEGDAWQPRTSLLSPFDPLIGDRERTEALFDFRFRLEIYLPAERRHYGYYVMPILDGDALIGRIDPAYDRKRKTLSVHAVFSEPNAPPDAGERVAGAIGELAAWLGAESIEVESEVPAPWRAAFAALGR